MKRKPNRPGQGARSGRFTTSRLASTGIFTSATAAALIASCPVNVTVTFAPDPGQTVISRSDPKAATGNPVCVAIERDQATFTR
ncbi:hypothetical protein [Streptomyces sp. NPDC017958]|uniref:hypothetical protein n=1 Tax=Streptomyces sp. NPDC017958 TaxID=3365021 RepID=UPI00378A731C